MIFIYLALIALALLLVVILILARKESLYAKDTKKYNENRFKKYWLDDEEEF